MPEVDGLSRVEREAVAEGRADDCDEVVTRQPYGNVWLNHLLSRESKRQLSLIPRSVCRLSPTGEYLVFSFLPLFSC